MILRHLIKQIRASVSKYFHCYALNFGYIAKKSPVFFVLRPLSHFFTPLFENRNLFFEEKNRNFGF